MSKVNKSAMHEGQNKLARYIRLDCLLRSPKGYTIDEIICDEQMDMISERTLRDNLEEFEKVFGAVFVPYSKSRSEKKRLWRYEDPNFSIFSHIREAFESLNCFAGDPRYDYVRFFLLGLTGDIQDTPNIMSFDNNIDYRGLGNMEPLAQAIIHKYPVKLTYKPYNGNELKIDVHPYHLHQYNKRWYLFGLNEEKQEVHNYPLDRIERVEHLSKKYIPTEINFDEYFDDIIGVSNYKDRDVCNVILKVNKKSIDYIRTKPLHCSQTELKEQETEQDVIIKLKVKINTELEMLIFSYSDAIEVLEPKCLRYTIARRIKNMSEVYKV